jgi:phosphatidylglycerophosphatase A
VWLCGVAEVELGQKDPSSVVMDEIVAMPVCFGSWLGIHCWQTDAFPRIDLSLVKANWLPTVGIFLAFRLFDVWKPWPVRQSQVLPGGWGVTIDDILAALYVNLAVLGVSLLKG